YAFVFYIIVGCEAYKGMNTKKATPAELAAARAKVGVKATSDKDIAFTLTDPAPYFVPITALWQGWPVRESDVTKGGDKWTEPATYIGNGPFKLTEWKHNEKMVYERNDNYRKKIQIKTISKAADGGFIPPGFPGYDKSDNTQKYDVAAAKALLDKASPASKAGLTGLKYTFSSTATNKARAEWAQGQWKTNLGVTVELDPVQSTAYTALFKKGQDAPQLFFLGWCADFPDQQNWHSTVWSTGGVSAARTGYSSKAFDDLTKAADKEADATKRDATYNQAGIQLSKDAPAAWVFYDQSKYL